MFAIECGLFLFETNYGTGYICLFFRMQTFELHLMEPIPDLITTVVMEDKVDEMEYVGRTYKEAEDSVRSTQKQNSTLVINNLKIQPISKFRLHVPLCRLISMPLVRPTMRSDVKRLEAEFVHGYRDGDRVFYISMTSDTGEEKLVTPGDEEHWGPHWQLENEEFESKVKADPDLASLSGHMFFVWDGNHRLLAWRQFIDRVHCEDRDWHLSVECIVLNVGDSAPLLLNAMHDINM